MNRQRLIVIGFAAFIAFVLIANTLFVIDQRTQAVVTRLGEPVRIINAPGRDAPGLKLKVPFLEEVHRLDKRNLTVEPQEEEIIASNQERLVVDAFVRYRINDPLQFYRAVRTEQVAQDRLERLVNSSLRQALGNATTEQIISSRRADLMQAIKADVSRRALASRFGIEIVDLRIKRADLPSTNAEAVYERMKTQRQQEAAQIRAVGEQQRREIVATATEEAERTRGEGDAQRAATFAAVYGKDASFASFYRSMRAYEMAMANGDTTLVLSPDSEFFKYFSRGPGG